MKLKCYLFEEHFFLEFVLFYSTFFWYPTIYYLVFLKLSNIKKRNYVWIFIIYKYFVDYAKLDTITNSLNGSIAIVDDEPDTIHVFIKLLQDKNYKVKGFTDPLLILEYISQHPDEFNLIILDYRMSPMRGCELANEIAKINPRIKMVLITAYDDIINNSLNLEIIKKPITLNELLEIVQRYTWKMKVFRKGSSHILQCFYIYYKYSK